MGGGGAELDPLVGMDDTNKPLRSRLLAVPALRTRYLQHVRTIARESLDWKFLGPIVADYRKLIEKELELDTRKLSSMEEFEAALSDKAADANDRQANRALKPFVEKRRRFLLEHAEIAKLPPEKKKKKE